MNNGIVAKLSGELRSIRNRLIESNWGKVYISEINSCLEELEQPCIIAVAGEVSAGKSSLINALLDVQYSQTGVNETTAILTYFIYGTPEKGKEVKCIYKNGDSKLGSTDLLLFQAGNDEQKLNTGIDYFEVYVDNPILKTVTIVDTPGTGSTLGVHNDQINKVIDQEGINKSLSSYKAADAIIYLFKYVAKIENLRFIEDFNTQISSHQSLMNIVGVITQIDKNETVLNTPDKFAKKIEDYFFGKVNTVIPVSTYLYQSISLFTDQELIEIREEFRKIPKDDFEYIIDDVSFFISEHLPEGCPSVEYRKKICQCFGKKTNEDNYPWVVFKRILCFLYKSEDDLNLRKSLINLSGFEKLREDLQKYLFDRSKIIVCKKIAVRFLLFLKSILDNHINALNEEKRLSARKASYLKFLQSFDNETARSLYEFVSGTKDLQFTKEDSLAWLEEEILKVEDLICIIDIFNDDLRAETCLRNLQGALNEEEYRELSILFGFKREILSMRAQKLLESAFNLNDRYEYWQGLAYETKIRSNLHIISNLAMHRYNLLLDANKIKSYDEVHT